MASLGSSQQKSAGILAEIVEKRIGDRGSYYVTKPIHDSSKSLPEDITLETEITFAPFLIKKPANPIGMKVLLRKVSQNGNGWRARRVEVLKEEVVTEEVSEEPEMVKSRKRVKRDLFGVTKKANEDNLSECFASYVTVNNLRNNLSARKPVMEFVGIGDQTIRQWMRGIVPVGEYRIRLRTFLAVFGYQVKEHSTLHEVIRNFSELVAFRLLTVDDAISDLSLGSKSHFFQVMVGMYTPKKARLDIMRKRIRSLQGFLNIKKQELAASGNVIPQSEVLQSPQSHSNDLTAIIASLRPQLQNLIVHGSKQDRDAVRNSVGGENLLFTSTLLNALCSEEARKRFIGGQHSIATTES